jgi:IclR family transcriptional regulator, acetate operon repressor
MEAAGPPATLITSVQRALRLLEAASTSADGLPAKQLARSVGLPIGTTYHLLRTLTFEGYLQRLPNGSYVLGDEVARLLDQSEEQAVLQRTRPALAALRDAAHAPAYLAFYADGEIIVKDIQDSAHLPRIDMWVGFRDAAHATALGKCVLAFLDPEARQDYLARHPLYDLTSRTITDPFALARVLDQVRLSGVAVDDGEYLPGNACVAVPVLAPGVTGTVGLSLPRRRLHDLQGVAATLEHFAGRIARLCALTI